MTNERMTAELRDSIGEFKRAVHRRDAKALRRVLELSEEARAAINEPFFDFDSPALTSVAGSGDLELVDVLLEFGADPNRKSDWWAGGFHPLYAARGPVADRLIAAGAVPDACAAAQLDRPDLLAQILRENPSRVHERGGDGQTPLHFARSRAVADLLLDSGADIDARDVDHRSTPAEWMLGSPGSAGSRVDLARYLVERGATADIFLVAALGLADRARTLVSADPAVLSLRTSQGEYGEKAPSSYHIYQWTLGPNLSPLQVAAKYGQHEVVEVMKTLASPQERLLLACHTGNATEAREIVAANPGIVSSLDDTGRRALTDEAWSANAPAVELMLELGFDPSVSSNSGPRGGTALHCAAWEGSVACVEALLRHASGRALLNVRESNWNGTPLSWCCHGSKNCGNPTADHARVARLLLDAGAEITEEMARWDCADPMKAVLQAALENH
jgi:ankyrin repeat protein